jgi:hypothetical protein
LRHIASLAATAIKAAPTPAGQNVFKRSMPPDFDPGAIAYESPLSRAPDKQLRYRGSIRRNCRPVGASRRGDGSLSSKISGADLDAAKAPAVRCPHPPTDEIAAFIVASVVVGVAAERIRSEAKSDKDMPVKSVVKAFVVEAFVVETFMAAASTVAPRESAA